jgi:hypothetical protein
MRSSNVLLSRADRSRFVSPTYRSHRAAPPAIHGTVLTDGVVCATRPLDRDKAAYASRHRTDRAR